MKKHRQSAFYLFIVTILFVAAVSAFAIHPAEAGSDLDRVLSSQENWMDVPTNQLIVKYKPNINLRGGYAPAGENRLQLLRSATGVELEYSRALSNDSHVMRLPGRMSVTDVEKIARDIAALPDVEYAEPDYIMFPALTPNDPQYGSQWHYFETYGINLPQAWDFTVGSSNVRIAVLDTGITDHTDLTGRWEGGYDFIMDVPTANDGNGRDNDPNDPGNWITFAESSSGPFAGCPVANSTWHGTHVAGTIGAAGNNGNGVVGVNWVSKIVPVRVLGKCGGFTSDIADGMRWAAGLTVSGVPANTSPARVLNLSLAGLGACSSTYQNAIDAVNAAGAIVVVAAGNNSANLNTTTIQPANCNGVITVAATDRGGDKASSSNYGSTIEISAPGGETVPTLQNGVFSTLNTGVTTPGSESYGFYSGTSMAAPHVSGVISLMLSLDPTLTATEILQLLQSTARSFPGGSSCSSSTCGSGIVDAGSVLDAIGALSPTSTATNTATSTGTYTATNTATLTPTATFTRTSTSTDTPSLTPTATFTATNTPTLTPTSTFTKTNTPTHTPSFTPTATLTPTNTSVPPTATFTPTRTPTVTFTSSSTPTKTATATHTSTAPFTHTATRTFTPSNTPEFTPTRTPSPTITYTASVTVTKTSTPIQVYPPTSTVTALPSFLQSRILTPSSMNTQGGSTSGSLSSLGLLQQHGNADDPDAYVTFRTPDSVYIGDRTYQLAEDMNQRMVYNLLLQVNYKGPVSAEQIWIWSIYDWNTTMWIKLGDTIGSSTGQWNTLVFRIRNLSRYISPGGEIRIQLRSNNANGDAKIDYESIHITYRPLAPTPTYVVPTVPTRRPGIASAPTNTPVP